MTIIHTADNDNSHEIEKVDNTGSVIENKVDKETVVFKTNSIYDSLTNKEKMEIYTAFKSYNRNSLIYAHILGTTNILHKNMRRFKDENNQIEKKYIKEEDLSGFIEKIDEEALFYGFKNTEDFLFLNEQKFIEKTYNTLLKIKHEYLTDENYRSRINKKIENVSFDNKIDKEYEKFLQEEEFSSLRELEASSNASRKVLGNRSYFHRGSEIIDISSKIHKFPMPLVGDYKPYVLENLQNATLKDLTELGKPIFPFQVPFYSPKNIKIEKMHVSDDYADGTSVNLIDYALQTNNIYEMNEEKFHDQKQTMKQKNKIPKKSIPERFLNKKALEELNKKEIKDEDYEQSFISEEEERQMPIFKNEESTKIKRIKKIETKEENIVLMQNDISIEKFKQEDPQLLKRYDKWYDLREKEISILEPEEMKEMYPEREKGEPIKEFRIEDFGVQIPNIQFHRIINKLFNRNYMYPNNLDLAAHNFHEWPKNLKSILTVLHEVLFFKHKELDKIMQGWLDSLDFFMHFWSPKNILERGHKKVKHKFESEHKYILMIKKAPLEISFVFMLIHDLREIKFLEEDNEMQKGINWLYEFFFKFFNVYSMICSFYQSSTKVDLNYQWEKRNVKNKKED